MGGSASSIFCTLTSIAPYLAATGGTADKGSFHTYNASMTEVAHAGQDHCQACFVSGRDYLVIAH